MRKKKESLEKEIIQVNMPGGIAKGRPTVRWTDNIRTWTRLAMKELLRLVENRDGGMLCRPRPTLGFRMDKNRKEQNM